jgi:PKD repeat protein
MRSIGTLAVITATLVLASACSDGSNITPPPANTAPVANFDLPPCTINQACNFASTSTDDAEVTGWSWDFDGDGTPDATTANASFTYTTAGDFNVRLTARDAQGLSDTKTSTITIAPPVNPPPTAGFTYTCNAADCSFTSTSTDVAPGTIATYAWTFGDGATEDWNAPSHVYTISARTTFTVTLTVTDNEGATAVATQRVTLSPLSPAVQGCTTSGKIVECVLDIAARSTLKLTLLGINCDLVEKISTPPPVGDQVFFSVCRTHTVGDALGIFGGRLDELWVYQAGTQARIWFTQGVSAAPLDPPAGHLVGTFPDWTLNFEDGDHPGAPGEPDFTDVVVGVHATVR